LDFLDVFNVKVVLYKHIYILTVYFQTIDGSSFDTRYIQEMEQWNTQGLNLVIILVDLLDAIFSFAKRA